MGQGEWWTLVLHGFVAVANLIALYVRLKNRQD